MTSSALGVGFGRIAVGAIALAAIAARWDPRGVSAVLRLERPPAICAAVATAIYQAAFFSAVALTGVALGTVVALGSAPIFTGALAFLVAGEHPEPRWGIATGLAVGGCTLILAPWGAGAREVSSLGVALALLSGFTYGLYTVSARRLLLRNASPLGVLTVTLGGGALLLAPLVALLAAAGRVTIRPLFSLGGVCMLAWLGVITVAAAYGLYATGLRRVRAATVGSLALGEPLTASLLGFIVLGERPGTAALAGAALLGCGLVLLALPSANRTPA